jgi:hypothetical protein
MAHPRPHAHAARPNVMTTAIPKLVYGLTQGLFRADLERHWRSFKAYDAPQAVITRQKQVVEGG